MITKTDTTKIDGLSEFGYEDDQYPVVFQQFESVTEMIAKIGKCSEDEVEVEAPQGALDSTLGVGNAAQKQGATQGGKEKVRAAMKTGDQEKVDDAIAKHQETCAKYVIGAPRGGGTGGVTKTKAAAAGKALLEKLGGEALAALAAEHGLDLDDLS